MSACDQFLSNILISFGQLDQTEWIAEPSDTLENIDVVACRNKKSRI